MCFLAAFAAVPPSRAATISSATSGNWSDGTTWVGGVAPSNGDFAQIAASHTVTIPAGHPVTVGDGASSISLLTGGHLVMNANLTLAGNMTLWADGSTALTTTLVQAQDTMLDAQSYNILNGMYNSSGAARSLWTINGAAGHRATVTGTTGKIDYYVYWANTFPGGVNWQYANIVGFKHPTDANRVTGYPIQVTHCMFKNGNTWEFDGSPTQAHVIDNNDFRNLSAASVNAAWPGSHVDVKTGAGTHPTPVSFRGNTFYGSDTKSVCLFFNSNGIHIDGCVTVGGSYWFSSSANLSSLAFFENNIQSSANQFVATVAGGTVPSMIFDDCLFVSSPNKWNLHLLIMAGADHATARNCVLQGGSEEDNFADGGHPNWVVDHNLMIKYGALYVSTGPASNQCPMVCVTNNTVQANAISVYGNLCYSETGPARDYELVSGNIAGPWSSSSAQYCALSQCTAAWIVDSIDEVKYNAYFNHGNPQFVKALTNSPASPLIVSAWASGGTPAYVSASQFSVAGDRTANWTAGTRVRLTHAGDKKRCLVASSSYDGAQTTVTTDYPFVESTLSKVEYSQGTNYSPYGTGDFGGTDLPGWVDPGFVDPTRTVEGFAVLHGATVGDSVHNQLAFVFNELLKRNGTDIGGNPATPDNWDADDVKLYLRSGFLPTNTILWTADGNGSCLGAISPYLPTLADLTPASLQPGVDNQTFTISGANLNGGTVRFSDPGLVGGAAAFSGNQVTLPVSVAPGASSGVVTITTPAGSVSGLFVVSGSSAVAPTIVTQPATVTVTAGQTASFGVTADGTAPLTYQWLENGAPIGGATAATYTTGATTTNDDGAWFSVTVSNAAGSATSSNAILTVNNFNALPYAESFEDLAGWGGVYASVIGRRGWTSSSPGTDCSRITNLVYTFNATNPPLPSATHTNVLKLDTQGAALWTDFGDGFDMSTAKTYLDMLVQFIPGASQPATYTTGDSGVKAGVCANASSNLAVYHGVAAADGTLLSNTVDATTVFIDPTNWYRLTCSIDATATNQTRALAMFQVKINGAAITNGAAYGNGWKLQYDATGQLPATCSSGTWFRLATTNGAARRLTGIFFEGAGYADDLVATTLDPFASVLSGGTFALIVAKAGNGRSSLGSASYAAVTVAGGATTQLVYAADDWYRISALASNGAPIAAAGGTRVFTQTLANIAADISNNVSFALAATSQTGYSGVPTAWLTNWPEARVCAGRDAFDIPTKYLLGLDPTVSNSYALAVDALAVAGSNTVVAVKRTVTGALSPDGMHGQLLLQGADRLGGGFTNIPATAVTGPAAFNDAGRRTYTNAVDGAVRFYRAIVERGD